MSRTALYRLLRRHGLTPEAAFSIISALLPQDWLRRVERHPRGAVFKAAVAHYLRRVSAGESTEQLGAELRRWSAVICRPGAT